MIRGLDFAGQRPAVDICRREHLRHNGGMSSGKHISYMQRTWWAIFLGLFMAAGGCGPSASTTKDGSPQTRTAASAADLGPQQIFRRLLDTYRQADSYADDSVVRLHFLEQGRPIEEEWKSSVRFARPNRLALDAFQATVRCDGKELRARIEDEATGDIDNQVLVRPAPKELTLGDLASDPLLYDILASQIHRQPIQLELLLESAGLAAAFGEDIACKRLADGEERGETCFRIEVPSPGGAFVFWVDQQKFLLRRLDYPAAALVPELAQNPDVSDLALWVELREARLNPPLAPDEFQLAMPAGAKRMQSFVVPPRPLPSSLFGKEPADFYFTTLDDNQLSRSDLMGKVSLLVWYREHEACRPALAEASKLRQEFADNQDVAIYAVSTDPTTASNDDLLRVLRNWETDLPVVRDLEAFGRSVFAIESQPTIVVLDGQGRVQIYQVGVNPELAAQLSTIVGQLLRGEDVAAGILSRVEAERQEYERLVAAGGPAPQAAMEIPEAAIKARSEPAKLKLKRLWNCRELKSPGNIYVVGEGDDARILVCDGVRTVAELSRAGKLLARHELDLPTGAAVTYLRTGMDAEGKRWYAASAPLAGQLFVFDETWQTVAAYPAAASPAPIYDLLLADLGTDDGLSLYVGFVGEAGLHAATLRGKSRWNNKTFPNVVSIAVAPPADDLERPRLLLTGEDGTILPVNRFGNAEPRKTVGQRPIARLATAAFRRSAETIFLGMSGDLQGSLFAVGIDAQVKEQWSYPLPPAIHQVPIEAVASGNLLSGSSGVWVIAAADGSIHIVSDDGRFTDTWNYGAALSGIAAARLDDQPVILVATPQDGVTAWSVE
ncbi:MAG TPA: TlpA disulfide reductase family protein [Pirellulaceae bacterium]|nr:TlpA disulfide reductase family protein [Pirellulaceae bacterium]